MTIAVTIGPGAVDISDGLVDDTLYLVEADLASSGSVCLLHESAAPPNAGVAAHKLRDGEYRQFRPVSGMAVWAWTPDGSAGTLAITEAP